MEFYFYLVSIDDGRAVEGSKLSDFFFQFTNNIKTMKSDKNLIRVAEIQTLLDRLCPNPVVEIFSR